MKKNDSPSDDAGDYSDDIARELDNLQHNDEQLCEVTARIMKKKENE